MLKLKTININLIGDFGKTSKINIREAKRGVSSDTRVQIYAYILIISILVLFAISFGSWLFVKQMTSNLDKKIVKLNNNLNILREEEILLSEFRQNLKKEKEINEFKIVAQNQINNSFLPWSSVLKEIATKIPTNIIVLKIEKTGTSEKTKEKKNLKLKISGIIQANIKPYPLTLISLFIFNLNEKETSLLTNASISKLEFNEKTKAYEFEIETSIRR